MLDDTTTLNNLREAIRVFVAEREWEPFHSPKNLAVALTCEAAELLEHFQWIDNEESRRLVQKAEHRDLICEEIADVFWVCLALVNVLGVDLSDIFHRKMAKNQLKYPADKARGRYRVEES